MVTIILIVLGIIFLSSNSSKKGAIAHTCNRCGEKYIGNTCLKCGYTGYASETINSSPFKGIIGYLLLIMGIISIPVTIYLNKNNTNDVNNHSIKNKVNNIIKNIIEFDTDDNTTVFVPDVDENTSVPDENTITEDKPANNPTKPSNPNNNPTDSKPKYTITANIKNAKNGSCIIKSVNPSITEFGNNQIEVQYTISFEDTKDPTNSILVNMCVYKVKLYNKDTNAFIKEWNELITSPGKGTHTDRGFSFANKDGYSYYIIIE